MSVQPQTMSLLFLRFFGWSLGIPEKVVIEETNLDMIRVWEASPMGL